MGGGGFAAEFFRYRGFIKSIGFAGLDVNRVLWAMAEAGAESVAQVVRHQACLAVNDLNRAFGAGRYAETASVAFFFIDMNDVSFHALSPFAQAWQCCLLIVDRILPQTAGGSLDRCQEFAFSRFSS
jgi:hypothetical protein